MIFRIIATILILLAVLLAFVVGWLIVPQFTLRDLKRKIENSLIWIWQD